MKLPFLLIACLAAVIQVSAQQSNASTDMRTALAKADSLFKKDNAAGVQAYLALAAKGSARAMNDVGIAYARGRGVPMNDTLSFEWCEKAANAGYARAWYNVGTMYKEGIGVKQDFEKAYASLSKGAALGDASSLYAKGFFLYEGLGCTQSYEQAIPLFYQAAALHESAGMYMLGLCFRNGYGMPVNTDSARYWLQRSASYHYYFAQKELNNPLPENVETLPAEKRSIYLTGQSETGSDVWNNVYHKVSQNLSVQDLPGEYTGYEVKFDWSGQHVISYTPLRLRLSLQGKELTGDWTEDSSASAQIHAIVTDTALVFSDSKYSRKDHYDNTTPNLLEFKNAKLQLTKSRDTVFLTGNIRMQSIKEKEIDKPTFVMLRRVNEPTETMLATDSSVIKKSISQPPVQFTAYPNPFHSNLNLVYTLQQATSVRIVVCDARSGAVVYRSGTQQQAVGTHKAELNINAGQGVYVVTLYYGDTLKSVMVFKQ